MIFLAFLTERPGSFPMASVWSPKPLLVFLLSQPAPSPPPSRSFRNRAPEVEEFYSLFDALLLSSAAFLAARLIRLYHLEDAISAAGYLHLMVRI